jgi:molybdenum cofactor cytidylyltransferase
MIAGLILAAGESSRMGADKALLTYRGRTFLETVFNVLREAGIERIVIVLGHRAERIEPAVNLPRAEFIFNPNYRRGQTSSLQAGLRALATPECEAVVLCLVDHPLVSPETIRRLTTAFQRSLAPVVIPTHQDRRGHPVLIARSLFEELAGLDPDTGANTVLRKHRQATQFVEVRDAGILVDVDDRETYRCLQQAETPSTATSEATAERGLKADPHK